MNEYSKVGKIFFLFFLLFISAITMFFCEINEIEVEIEIYDLFPKV